MTRKPDPRRPVLERFHLVWWVLVMVLLVPMASCTNPEPTRQVSFPATPTGSAPGPPPSPPDSFPASPTGTEVVSESAPPSSAPATPAGTAVKSVVDVPIGDIYVGAFQSTAVDDVSGDLFFFGSARDAQERVRSLYRLDPRTGSRTVLATLPESSPYKMDHLVATNGWVFWVQRDVESLEASGRQRLVHLAIRADGSQRRVLGRYVVPAASPMGEPSPDSGFEAGGGTAMWLETRRGGRTIHLFDTRTAKTMLVKNQPKVREMVGVHGDRVVLTTDAGMQIYSIRTGQFSEIHDNMWEAMASGVMVVGWLSRPHPLTACFFTSPADPTGCDTWVAIETTPGFFPRCIIGTYVVGYTSGRFDVVEFINVALPRDRTSVKIDEPGVTGSWSCGGKSLIQPWLVVDRSGFRSYLRVITVR